MSKTTDFLLEVMDRHQFDEVSELQDYVISTTYHNGVPVTSIVKNEKLNDEIQILSATQEV